MEGDAAERRFGRDVVRAVLGEDRRQHILQHGEHVVLAGEGHLHIELVELAGTAVAARVLVAEAGRDLEIAVKARRHQKLLELLRRLRQGVELAGMLARGNEIVARALRRRRREDRRGDLQKAVLGHSLPQGGHHLAAEDDVLLHSGVAQIEIAVLQAQRLVRVAASVDLERQLVVPAAAEHLDLVRHDLNVAGGLLGVLAGALAHHALDRDGRFLVQGLDDLHHVLGLDDDLRGAIEITDDDKREILPDLADIFHPADDAHALPGVFEPQLAAIVGTGLKHTPTSLSFDSTSRYRYSWMTEPALRSSMATRSIRSASLDVTVCCSPVVMFLTEHLPCAISSSPRKMTNGTPSLSA